MNYLVSITLTEKELECVLLALLHATKGNQNAEAVEQFNKIIDELYPRVSESFKTTFDIMRMIP